MAIDNKLKSTLAMVLGLTLGLGLLFIAESSEARAYQNGELIRRKSGGTVYRIKAKDNVKRPILSPDVFRAYRYNWNNISEIKDSVVDNIPTGEMIVYKSQTLLTSGQSGTVWVINRPERKYIPSAKVFNLLGYKWRNVKKIKHKKLKRIPYGGSIDINVNNMISVTANERFIVKDSKGNRLARVSANDKVDVGYSNGIYLVSIPSQGKTIQRSRWIRIHPTNGGVSELLDYDNKYHLNRFRGRIDIRHEDGKLWAVNTLRLEDYLPGMIEAGNVTDNYGDKYSYMKAMTVIARSYAGYYIKRGGRHGTNLFHLKNSRYGNGSDQVYGGFNAESNAKKISANRTKEEYVTNASGTILITPYSHGGYVNESRNSCLNKGGRWRDGANICMRTKSSTEVWGGDIPHCQPVIDRFGDTNWECGTDGNHCVGLSAYGAMNYANRNDNIHWNYKKILKHYYSGISVKDKNWNPNIKVGIYNVKP